MFSFEQFIEQLIRLSHQNDECLDWVFSNDLVTIKCDHPPVTVSNAHVEIVIDERYIQLPITNTLISINRKNHIITITCEKEKLPDMIRSNKKHIAIIKYPLIVDFTLKGTDFDYTIFCKHKKEIYER